MGSYNLIVDRFTAIGSCSQAKDVEHLSASFRQSNWSLVMTGAAESIRLTLLD
ncbi:hypothetical protein BO82DRAFT_358396 [Aspergillus uvarum CBS 121591]|uniref:Uncharacterized protein n=1 Tax=Aspergillus uvarum CBS 121591 TaxID=1448315 RepID=A0A319BX32_9EURO|nr:hypothetical protein BO82DRAFT_358396 [Aspergillus uvarum CBS 121591]PYH77285.1 hypothetical protein BO82DRAFT_358396 [Aspergillus uvarum CBS 121591]